MMNIDEDLNRRKKEAEKAAQQKAAAAPERGWAGVDADLDRRKAQQEATQRMRETERRQEEERRRMRTEQLARLSVGMGPEPLKPYSMQAETKALLSPLEQLKNQNTKYPRSFTDRDSVLQGKVAETAAQRGNFAAFTGNDTEYAKNLKNYQRAVGNLVQNAAEEDHRQYRAYLKDNPDVAYARSMHADEIERKITEAEQERAELEARRKANWDERQGIKLRGEVAYYDSHHVAHYGSKYDALEREDREAYARLQELEKELETLNSAKGLRTTFDAEKRVNAFESQARSNADFEALSSGRPESLNAFIGRNNGKNPENSWAQMVTQKYYGMTPDQKSVFHYLWAKDDEAGHAINGNEREAVQYMNAIPGLHDYYQKRQAEDAYIPQSYDNPLEKIAKVGRYLIDSLATGTDRAINADMVAKGVKAKNQDLLALAGQYAPEGFGGTMFRAAGSAAQSTGQMIPAMMAGNLAAAYVSAFPAAVASAGKATHDIVTAERIVKSAQNAVFFYTSKGQAMADAKEKGLTDAQAEIYSLLSAASEVWLQNAIGGVAQFGGIGERDIMLKINKINNAYLRTAAYHGLNVAGEVIEEEAQYFLEPLFVTMLTGQEYEMPSLQELLETFLSTAMMVSTTNVGANKEFYNSSKIRSNLQTMAELCRQEGGEYDQVAKSIEQYIQEVDAEPDGRFTKEGFYQAFNLVQMAEENMKAHGVTAEDVRSGMAELNEGAAAEDGTPPHPSATAQNDAMESGRPMTAPTEDGGQRHEVRAHATEEAIQAARDKGRSIAIRSAETMDDGMIQATIRASEESAAGARQEGDLETAAMHEGIVQGLREVFDQRMAQSDGLSFEGELRRSYETENGGRPMTALTGESGQAMLAPTENGGRQSAVPTGQEGLSYGTERAESGSGLADGVQRDAGLGTGGQAGGLGEGAGGSVARGGRAQELAQLKNLIRASESPRTSAKEIGVRGGTNNQNLFVFSEDEQTPGMQKVQEDAAANGTNVVFFGGGRLEVRASDGRIQKADALYQTNRDGSSTMYIRTDLAKYTPEQLYKHESFHDAVAKNKGLLLDMVEDLYEKYSEAEISKMVDAYVVATDGIYGDGEDAVRLYLEEILADQYSGMNRGGNEAARAREAVAGTAQRFAGDIEKARQNRAGIDNRNGPGQRFSIQDVQGQKGDYPDCVVLDTNLFDGVKPRDWGKVLQNHVYNNLADKELAVYDENWYREVVKIARYQDRVTKTGAKNSHRVIDDLARNQGDNIKNLAVAHIPELLVVSTYDKGSLDNKHQWLDQNGWTYRKAYICDKAGKIYEATLNIAEGRDRRILYDISLIREIDRRTAGGVVPSTVTGRGSPTSRSSSKKILPDPNVPVKHFSSEEQTARIDEDYLKAVSSGDMRTAQRMVDEAAKAAGYDIKAYHGTGSLFNVFDLQKSGSNSKELVGDAAEGMFFFASIRSAYPGSAQDYARMAGKKTGKERIQDVYLKITNPLVLDSKGWYATADYYDNNKESIYDQYISGDYDGIIIRDSSGGDDNTIYLLDDANRIKSADPVTYDDSGKVVPLSERFNPENEDIRFSAAEDEEDDGLTFSGDLRRTYEPEYSEALPQNRKAYKWSEIRNRVSEMNEAQRRQLVEAAAEEDESTWQEEGLGIKPFRGSLADTKAVVDYVDNVVRTLQESEPGAGDYEPTFELEALPQKADKGVRFSAADEEDDGLAFTGNLRRNYEEDGGQIARAADADEGGRQGAVPTEAEDFEMLAREKKLALAEKVGIDGLKSRIETAESRLRMWKAMEKTGLMAKDAKSVQELKSRIADAQETVDIFRDALKKKQEARKAEQADKAAKAERQKKRAEEKKALRKEAELADNKPRQARKEFREEALNFFSVPAAKRQALGNILNSFADKMLAKGSVDTEDRAELFRQLYEAGVEVVQAEDYYRNIRETVDNARIYVPESVRAEFGDDWDSFRKRAWGNGVYLTNNQNDRGADSWNAELAEMFRGSFDPEETDARAMLENIVDLAEEGKAEFVSLPEMMRRNQSETGVTVDEQMDELERKVDHMIDTFAKKADLETRVRTQGAMKLAKERQKNRELAARQVQRKRENDTRNEVMKQLQSLNKMRKRSAPEIQQQIDQIIGNLDTMARSISPEGMENLQALARKYMEAKDDPNFLGNPYVEARLARLSQVQLDDLEISDVIELGRTISALVKSVTEDKRLLTDEREKEISEAAKDVRREIASSAGSKGGKLREFLGNEHLSPTRELQRIGGWNRGGMMEKLSRALEDGGTRRMDYQRQATRIFDGFLADKANQKWLQKAQGKDADWITVTVPAGITGTDVLSGEPGPLDWKDVTFEITPMMRVGLLMHSRNVDNLRHIETGGIVIPNREYYRKGDLANADAKGPRVKLRPEIARAIVKDCTPQERAFASLLEKYYDGFSKEKINEVSMLIDGFERAGGNHYYGIKVSRKFLASLPEQIQKNMSLESIGSIVNERVHAGNPIILEDASKALTDHIDLISKYYGFTAPIRDFNAVMNYTFHTKAQGENGEYTANAYAGSIKELLQDKWGAGAQKYIDELLADLQQSSGINETAAQFLAKLRGNLAGASLMFNPAVALSQTASLPGAMQTLGIDGVAASLKPEKVDMNLIEKYSPILWYRNQGNSTQELGDYMARQGLEGKLPFFFNWIQKMDAWTIRRLWAGAEYRVSKDTDLTPGSKAEIDAGTDPYYQEVARVFQRAVYDTQPNYSEMQRPAILRSKSDLTKMLTMYKTVPLQYYNMMYEAAGRLKADKARFEQDGSAENKANYAKSRSFAAKTFAGVLGANVVYVVMKAAIKALLGGKDKKYKDEEGDWDAGKIFGSLGKDLAETYAGSVIFGSELMSSMEKLYNAATTGSYSRYGGLEISALGAVEDTLGSIYNLAKELHDQDLTGGLGAIKELAKQISMDLGVPANNIETYLLGTAKWFAPEWVDRYENFFDEFERADLKGEHGKDLRAALRVLMDNRTDGLKDETIDELMRLWETGQNAAVPSGIPSSVSVDGEDVEIKGADRSTFRERWGQVVGENLEQLLNADAYKAADDAGKAKLISKLYEYARQQAATAVTDKQPDSWVSFGQACEDAGIQLTDYLAVASVDKSKLKDMDGQELDNAIRNRMSFRVGDLDEKTLDELGRLYADGETGVIPADVPTGISVGGEETKLTPEQRVEWLQAWQRTAGENLEALMASNDFQKADDAGKAKLISALYDVARAKASDEVAPSYEPDKWIRTGLGAEERGVPIDEYAAFHVNLSGLKTSEKLDLLKKQSWGNDQKEYIWEQTMATDAQIAKYQNLKNAGVSWSDAMDRLGIGASTTTTMLTESQQAQYDKYWNEISGPATQRLLNNSAYKSADKATQTEYLDRLNDYAARSAKAKVLPGYDKGKWVECGERLTSAGVKLDDYIVYYQNTSEGNNRAKYEALAKTGWTDSQKLIALKYISSSTYSAGKVGKSYEVPLTSYLEALSKADADQSGNINQEEATEWIDNSSVAWDLKAYLWQMLCYSSKWKNNPYSTTRGEKIWHSLHPEG